MTTVHVIHLSDVHVRLRHPGWRAGDFITKRVTGWFNLALRRGRRFELAAPLLTRIGEEIRSLRPDAVVFSGDATTLGFGSESAEVARLLGVHDPGGSPGIAVPGNHDHYTRPAVRARGFETAFAPWTAGQRVGSFAFPF